MNQKGFTFIELIIYIAIFAVISLVLTDFFITLAKVRAQTEARGEVRQNLARTMERLSQVIHSASGVNSASGNTLSLAMTDSAKNPTIFTVTGNAVNHSGRGFARNGFDKRQSYHRQTFFCLN